MNWLKAMEEAESADAVLGLLNEYRAQLTPEVWSWIPAASRPPRMRTADDVHDWHQRLVQALSEATNPNIRFQDLCVLFVRASAHLTALQMSTPAVSNHGHFAIRARPVRL